MRLYEYEGKHLLARYGVPIPEGGLWPDAAAELDYPVAVKAQILEGGRGKRGGIRFAADAHEAELAARALLAGPAGLPRASAILVERRLDIGREFYLALLMDRERRAPLLLASRHGGVEIESIPDEHILRLYLNPLVDTPGFVVHQVAKALALPQQQQPALAAVLSALWKLFVDQDCLLAEINPLVLTATGELTATDARLILDDNARWRHPDWPAPHEGSSFERCCSELGAAGTELDGTVAVVTSGAGLGMATVDMTAALGGTLRCFVDLGGSVFQGPESLTQIVDAVRDLRPRVVLFNYFFQFARADILAAGIAASYHRDPPECPVVIRMRGHYAEEARGLLAPFNFVITEDMLVACQAAVNAARDGVVDGKAE